MSIFEVGLNLRLNRTKGFNVIKETNCSLKIFH